ncbi:MAG: LysR family transcriptional regulator [Sneathiellaceae bacterium]
MRWDRLQTLHAVAESGSLTEAARRLRLSQPTVSRQIAALERETGKRLVLRGVGGVTLTPAAETLLADLALMGRAATSLSRQLDRSTATGGRVRITATEGLAVAWLAPALVALRDRLPAIGLDIVVENLSLDLARREADIAIRLFEPREPDLSGRMVAELGVGLYAAGPYLARHGAPQRLTDLTDHPLIGFPDRAQFFWQHRWLAEQVPAGRQQLRSNSLLTHAAAAEAGLGIALVAHVVAARFPGLQEILPDTDIPLLPIWLVAHMDQRRSMPVAAVFDLLADRFRRDRDRLTGTSRAVAPPPPA